MSTQNQVSARSTGRCRIAALGLAVATSLCATFAHAQDRSSTLSVSAVVVRHCVVNTQSLVVADESDSNVALTCSHAGQVAVQFVEGLARTTSSVGAQTLVQVNAQQGVSREADQTALRAAQVAAATASAQTAARTMTVTLMF